MWRRKSKVEARTIPFPRVCPDCFHDECKALVDAWILLTNAEKKDAENG